MKNKNTVFLYARLFILIICSISFIFTSCNQKTIENNRYVSSTTIPAKENTKNLNTNGIYKLSIIGNAPKTIALNSTDTENTVARIGMIYCSEGKYYITGRFYLGTDRVSGMEIGGNTSIFDGEILQNYRIYNSLEKIDIDKLVLLYYRWAGIQTAPEAVAYSKLINNNKQGLNNIKDIRFNGKIESTDVIADAVAVIKKDGKYKLLSYRVTYNVIGDIPKEMLDAAINQPECEFPTVDINKLFVVYLSSLNKSGIENGKEIYNANIVTYSSIEKTQ